MKYVCLKNLKKNLFNFLRIFFFQTMYPTYGQVEGCAISKDAKIAPTSSQRIWTVGFGLRRVLKSFLLIVPRPDGATTLGASRGTRKFRSRTMPNSTSTKRANLVWPSWIMCTTTVSRGTTLLVTMKNHSYAKIARSYWTTWPQLIPVSDCKPRTRFDNFWDSVVYFYYVPTYVILYNVHIFGACSATTNRWAREKGKCDRWRSY